MMNTTYYIVDGKSGSFSTLTREAYEIIKPTFEEDAYLIQKENNYITIFECYDDTEYDWRKATSAEILWKHFGKQVIEGAADSIVGDICDGKTVCLIIVK
jgi:hypothetical protein